MTQAGIRKSSGIQLDPPRFVIAKPFLIAGLKQRFTSDTMKNIPQLWQRFMPHIGQVPGQVSGVAYGLCSNMMSSPFAFDYTAGVQVANTSGLPTGFSQVKIPAQRYVVFSHRDHVSSLPKALDAVHEWSATFGLAPVERIPDLPIMFERYGEAFDPHTGGHDAEIWTPLKE